MASVSLRSKETEATKRSKLTEEQIAFALKQADAGQPVGGVCRQMGISEAAFYVWKKRNQRRPHSALGYYTPAEFAAVWRVGHARREAHT